MAEREMTGIEALEELINMIPKEEHINSIHNNKIDILKYNVLKFLDRLETLEKENEELKFRNKQLLEDNDFMNNRNRMLEDVVKLFKRNLYASILDNNMPKHKTEELLQLLDEVLGGIGVIYE